MAKKRKKRRYKRKTNEMNWVLIVGAIIFMGAVLVVFAVHQNQRNARLAVIESREAASSREIAKKQAFIDRIVPHAKEIQTENGILPSITIAQAILESDWGQSTLSKDYHNLFGIKGSDPSNTRELATKEFVDNKEVTVKARFRVYKSWEASMDDHAKLFVAGTDWNPQQYETVIAAKDYKQAALALQTAGYATDPDYANKLVSIVENYKLAQYDN